MMRNPIVFDKDGDVTEAMMAKDCSASALFNSHYSKEREEVARARCSEWCMNRMVEQDFLLFCQRIVHD